jgi:hypothetical protein
MYPSAGRLLDPDCFILIRIAVFYAVFLSVAMPMDQPEGGEGMEFGASEFPSLHPCAPV